MSWKRPLQTNTPTAKCCLKSMEGKSVSLKKATEDHHCHCEVLVESVKMKSVSLKKASADRRCHCAVLV